MRNTLSLDECLEEAYLKGPTVYNPAKKIPGDPEIPLLLNRVVPCHEVVHMDYHYPGARPWRTSGEALTPVASVELPYGLLKYD
jgi:NAD-reducing hydrogenase small subunit